MRGEAVKEMQWVVGGGVCSGQKSRRGKVSKKMVGEGGWAGEKAVVPGRRSQGRHACGEGNVSIRHVYA